MVEVVTVMGVRTEMVVLSLPLLHRREVMEIPAAVALVMDVVMSVRVVSQEPHCLADT